MGDRYPAVKVATVQAASVFLDREGSTAKACALIREAGRNGARVIGFPEGFIPAHPIWYHHHSATGALSNRLAVELFKNAVEIPGPQTEELARAARDANAYVVIGVCEKMPNTLGTMFNTQVYLSPDGTLIGKHQKIMPTVGGSSCIWEDSATRSVRSDRVRAGQRIDLRRELNPLPSSP
jgi:aliphatic nitrilase